MKTLVLLLLLTSQAFAYGPAKPNAAKKAAYQAAKLLKREAYLKKGTRPVLPQSATTHAKNAAEYAITTNYEASAAAAKISATAAFSFAHNFDPRCHKQHDYSVLNKARAVAREAEIKEFGHVRTPQELGFEP